MAVLYGKNYGKPTLDLNFAGNKSLIDTTTGTNYVTFSRAQSANEATYIGSDGLIKYAAADEARFDHDPVTGESLGLLIEESRTNLYPISETYTSWNVDNNATITTDGTTIAGLTAIKLTSNVDTNALFLEGNNATFTANTTYTSSVYHKVGNVDGFWFEARFFSGGGTPKIYFNSSTETWSATSGGTAPAIWSVRSQKVESNAWRHSITFYIGTDTAGTLRMGALAPANSTNVSTGAYGYLAAPQIEAGSFPTSYIPTTGTTVTRAADEASITGTNFSSWWNTKAGTFFSHSRPLLLTSNAHYGGMFGADGGSVTNPLTMDVYRLFGPPIGAIGLSNLRSPGTSGFEIAATSADPLNRKFVTSFDNLGSLSVCGGLEVVSLTDAVNGSGAIASVDGYYFGGRFNTSGLNKHVSRLTYYPKRLPDIELQQLTK